MTLTDTVALVAGATRGAGRGIAVALGEAGATVYCTGRSAGGRRSEYDRPETLEETAALVTDAGGHGIAVGATISSPTQVARRGGADRRRARAASTSSSTTSGAGRGCSSGTRPLWEHDLAAGLRLLRLGLETHLVTSHFALPLLIRRPGGLVVEMTDGTWDYNGAALPHQRLLRPRQERRSSGWPSPRRRSSRRTAAPRSRSRRAGCARR